MGQIFDELRKTMANMSQEEINKAFPKDTKPKGWLSIDDHLPMMLAIDITIGGTGYKVRHEDGTENYSTVSDHNTWYYYAKENGITHWWNE